MADADVPDSSGAGGNANGGNGRNGEEAVWLDLVARFDTPTPADGAPPWPDREDLAGPVRVAPTVPPSMPPVVPDALPREPPTNPTGLPGLPVIDNPLRGDAPLPNQPWPRIPATGAGGGLGGGSGPRDVPPVDNPAEDHYIPPVPPPLPKLSPITKGAWLALFGGPLYLLISTAVGIAISGLAAFLAVAAFVGGFVVIVARMDNGRPPDSGSDDDGAVV